MSGRNSAATHKALKLVQGGMSMRQAALKMKLAYSTVKRAIKRQKGTP